MIGVYNYTVILTYLCVVSAGIGMHFASEGSFKTALFCLMFSGLCDMLDGPVARTCRKRNDFQKKFGIQIDSLCDCISFGVQSGVLVYFVCKYNAGESRVIIPLGIAAGIALAICGVIRLAFFNVTEEERTAAEGAKLRSFYRGLPITCAAYSIPLAYLSAYFLEGPALAYVMAAAAFITAFLFILDFKVIKVHGKGLIIVGLAGAAVFAGIIFI